MMTYIHTFLGIKIVDIICKGVGRVRKGKENLGFLYIFVLNKHKNCIFFYFTEMCTK